MVEDRGVPVQDDRSIAPEDDRVKFSLSGVTPHWHRTQQMQQTFVTAGY